MTDNSPFPEREASRWRGRQLRHFIVYPILICVLLYAIFSLPKRIGPSVGEYGLAPGAPAPFIRGEGWLNGPPPKVEDLDGKVWVVDQWAFWCMPCVIESKHLVQLHERFRDQGVVFLGMTSEGRDELARSEQFIKQTGITWPNAYGARESAAAYHSSYLPSVWVVGRDGKIVWNSEATDPLEDAIVRALASPHTKGIE